MRAYRLLTREKGRITMKKAAAVIAFALTLVPLTSGAAWATDPLAETNVVERVECLFRVYVTEGGESGLDCLA